MPVQAYTPRVAVVTGSARGIGYSIAQRLAEDGFDVALNDLSVNEGRLKEIVEEINKKGRKCIAVPADVTSEPEVKELIEKVVRELGCVDVMVANAGIVLGGPFLQAKVEQLDSALAVNVRGTFLCLQYAALQMIRENHGGRLIAASSIMGKQGGLNAPAYSATKFAIRGIVQSTAKKLKQYGITVNAYAPGVIRTELVTVMAMMEMASANGTSGSEDDGPMREVKKNCGLDPDCPDAKPEVIASVVSYLAKPESYFITGQSLNVDGGVIFD